MLALPLTTAERRLFERSLISSHEVKVTVQLLDLNHKYLTDLSSKLIDGQVNVDGEAEVTRSCTVSILDPDGITDMDSDSPADAAIFADRMLRVVYSVRSDLLPKWVDVPVFCGPVTSFSRDEAVVSIEAQGKERFYQAPSCAWNAASYKKGTRLVTMLRDMLADQGETKFSLPEWTRRTTRDFNLVRESDVWHFCQVAKGPSWDAQLFYDGRGYVVLRLRPKTPVFTFDEFALTSKPKINFDTSALRNTVYVLGGTPKGKRQITAVQTAPRSHPVSTYRLGRNGKQRILMEKVEDDTLVTAAAAKERALSVLESVLLTSVTAEFSSFVIPHLEPEDVYTLKTGDFVMNQRVKKMTIPLKVGSDMTIGYHRRLSVNVGRIRGK